jgi:hypothetical protein
MSIRDAMPSYVRQAYEEVEKLQRINGEIENGEFLRVVGVKYVGRLGEVLKAGNKKKSKPFLDEIDDLNFQSAILEREVRKAIEKAKKLKTERVEVVKTMPKKPDANDVIRQILHGGVRGFEALKKVMVCGL